MRNLSIPPPPAHLNTFLQQRVYRSQVCTERPEYYLCYQCLCQFSCGLGVGSEGGVGCTFPLFYATIQKTKAFLETFVGSECLWNFYVQWHAHTQCSGELWPRRRWVRTQDGWGHSDPRGYQGAWGGVLLWLCGRIWLINRVINKPGDWKWFLFVMIHTLITRPDTLETLAALTVYFGCFTLSASSRKCTHLVSLFTGFAQRTPAHAYVSRSLNLVRLFDRRAVYRPLRRLPPDSVAHSRPLYPAARIHANTAVAASSVGQQTPWMTRPLVSVFVYERPNK